MAIPTFPSLVGRGWPLTRTTIWKTLKQESLSGKETRIPAYTYPRYQWSATFDVLRSAATYAELQTLMGFINSLQGAALPFYFTDTVDNSVTGQLFGEGDGTTTQFQLVRTVGGYSEPVQSVSATPTISVAGTPTSSFTLSNVGVVTFASAPAAAAALTWTGSFNWLCRLDDDQHAFSQFMSGLHELKKLSFTTIKV